MTPSFGENLRHLREQRGLSQERFGEMIGTTKQVISHYEKGNRTPKITMAARMAVALGVTLEELNTGVPQDKPVFTAEEVQHIVSTAPCDPDQMAYADQEDETISILFRRIKRMSPENRRKLLEIVRIMFGEDSDEEGQTFSP